MKHLLPFLLALLSVVLLSSCNRSIYQATELTYTGDHAGDAPYVTVHDGLILTYDFRGEGSVLSCTIQNQLNYPVVIDFTKSSLIVEGKSLPYFKSTVDGTFERSGTTTMGNNVNFAGTTSTGINPFNMVIAPGTEALVACTSISHPPATYVALGTQDAISLPIEKPWTYRHYLCYQIEDGSPVNQFIDDSFEVVSTTIMGKAAFRSYSETEKSQFALTGHRVIPSPFEGQGTIITFVAITLPLLISVPIIIFGGRD